MLDLVALMSKFDISDANHEPKIKELHLTKVANWTLYSSLSSVAPTRQARTSVGQLGPFGVLQWPY